MGFAFPAEKSDDFSCTGGPRSTHHRLQYSSQLSKAFLKRTCDLLFKFVWLEIQLSLIHSLWEVIKQLGLDFLEHQDNQSSGWSKWKGMLEALEVVTDSSTAPPSSTKPAGKLLVTTGVLRASKGLESSGWSSGTPGQEGSRFCSSPSGS